MVSRKIQRILRNLKAVNLHGAVLSIIFEDEWIDLFFDLNIEKNDGIKIKKHPAKMQGVFLRHVMHLFSVHTDQGLLRLIFFHSKPCGIERR